MRARSLIIARIRLLVILGLFGFAAVVCLARIAMLGLFESPARAASLAEALLPSRGEIADRNGVPLARAFPAYALWFNPDALGTGSPLVGSPAEVARRLALILPDADEAELRARLSVRRPGYLQRRLLPEQANRCLLYTSPSPRDS